MFITCKNLARNKCTRAHTTYYNFGDSGTASHLVMCRQPGTGRFIQLAKENIFQLRKESDARQESVNRRAASAT